MISFDDLAMKTRRSTILHGVWDKAYLVLLLFFILFFYIEPVEIEQDVNVTSEIYRREKWAVRIIWVNIPIEKGKTKVVQETQPLQVDF